MYEKKILKKENIIKKDKIIIWEFSLIIFDKSFTGRKPPEEMREKARFKESNALSENKFKIMKIISVKDEYNKKILIACLSISELFNEKKFVNDFLKLWS